MESSPKQTSDEVGQPARDAAEEIREWLGISGLVDGEGLNEVAAIISRHFAAAQTVAPSANCQCGHDRASHYKQFGPCAHDGCSACARFIESDNEVASMRDLLRHVLICSGLSDDCKTCEEAQRFANQRGR